VHELPWYPFGREAGERNRPGFDLMTQMTAFRVAALEFEQTDGVSGDVPHAPTCSARPATHATA